MGQQTYFDSQRECEIEENGNSITGNRRNC